MLTESGQSTIWPVRDQLPKGWHEAGKIGSKAECLAYINSGTQASLGRIAKRFWRILPVRRQAIGADLAGEDLRSP